MPRAVAVLVLAAHAVSGCVIVTSGLGTPDGAPPATDGPTAADTGGGGIDAGPPGDAGRDAEPTGIDAGPEAADGGPVAVDAGPSCVRTDEVCNARDDDCDGTVDETGCSCLRDTFGGHIYLFCTTSQSWTNAQGDCRDWRYDLVTIGDDEENEFVRMHLSGDTWIGLDDRDMEGIYTWSDGSSFGYDNWRSDAPRGSGSQDCVEIDPVDGTWLDVGCGGTRHYVCEVDPDR